MPATNKVFNLRGEQGTVGLATTTKTDAVQGHHWAAFLVHADAVLSAIVMPKDAGSAAYLGITYPQGYVFYGPISSITLASGTIQLFNFIDPSQAAAIRGA